MMQQDEIRARIEKYVRQSVSLKTASVTGEMAGAVDLRMHRQAIPTEYTTTRKVVLDVEK
jgi:hypothetical protein